MARFPERLARLRHANHLPLPRHFRLNSRFAEAYVDAELGTVVWPNGADVAPEFLYESVLRRQAVAERDTPRA